MVGILLDVLRDGKAGTVDEIPTGNGKLLSMASQMRIVVDEIFPAERSCGSRNSFAPKYGSAKFGLFWRPTQIRWRGVEAHQDQGKFCVAEDSAPTFDIRNCVFSNVPALELELRCQSVRRYPEPHPKGPQFSTVGVFKLAAHSTFSSRHACIMGEE